LSAEFLSRDSNSNNIYGGDDSNTTMVACLAIQNKSTNQSNDDITISDSTTCQPSIGSSDFAVMDIPVNTDDLDDNVALPSDFRSIKLPPRMNDRGRPKGAGLTIVGLPKRRKKDGPVPFVSKSPTQKESFILNFFVDNGLTNKVMHSDDLIEEHQVETRPELIQMKCLDDNVSIFC